MRKDAGLFANTAASCDAERPRPIAAAVAADDARRTTVTMITTTTVMATAAAAETLTAMMRLRLSVEQEQTCKQTGKHVNSVNRCHFMHVKFIPCTFSVATTSLEPKVSKTTNAHYTIYMPLCNACLVTMAN